MEPQQQPLQEEQQRLPPALLPLPAQQLHEPQLPLLLPLLLLAPAELCSSCELLRLPLLLPLSPWCLQTRAWCCSAGGTC
jgi:hypothetical protein